MPLSVATDRRLIRANAPTVRHMDVELIAPPAPPRDANAPRAPVAVTLVLDRSGSMGGEKIRLVREAAKQAVQRLGEKDQCAIVVYDNEITCLAPLAPVTPAHRELLLAQLDAVDARGSTNLSGGWFAGVDQLRMDAPSGLRRCLLLTDGLANAGITDHDRLAACAEQFRGQGIVTSTFGVGEDFDEHLLRGIAQAGGGSFYFIEAAEQIPELLAGEVGDALDVVLPAAALTVQTPPSVRVRVVDGRPMQQTPSGWSVRLGDLVDAQELHLLLAVDFPAGPLGERISAQLAVTSSNGMQLTAPAPIVWQRASAVELEAEPRDLDVDRATAIAYAAKARLEATAHNRHGELFAAGRVLRRTAARIAAYAAADPLLLELVASLRAEAEQFESTQQSPLDLKRAMFHAHRVMESRDEAGRPRRRRGA